ncbi:uncharacterized protein [Argopecten irradians]|uniref:uncharacterized protein n=1 Tax=Argopecten irradians TaxID=31199 RepID=UPI00371709EE
MMKLTKKTNEAYRAILQKYRKVISMPHKKGKIQDYYNFSVGDDALSIEDIESQLMTIFSEQNLAFKINGSFGFVLRDVQGNFRYFYPHNNETIFESPHLVNNVQGVHSLVHTLRNIDILYSIFKQRPSTKWTVYRITNVRWTVTRTSFPLGAGTVLPDYVKSKKSIISLTNDARTGRAFTDNLCLFRCLAYDRVRDVKNIERTAAQLFRDFTDNTCSIERFPGVPLSDLPKIEKHFSVNLNVFRLNEDGSVCFVNRTFGCYSHSINLNMYGQHLSYIKSFQAYSQKYVCRCCQKMFKTACDLRRHEQKCENATKLVYPGGYHSNPISVFQNLENYGYITTAEDRFYPYFITYDFEAMLRSPSDDRYEQEHVPVSCSVCSNVPGFEEPYCIVEAGDAQVLVKKFVDYLKMIQCAAAEEMRRRFGGILEELDEELVGREGDMSEDETVNLIDYRFKELRKARDNLLRYLDQIPVIGFNCSKYDLNLIKTVLVKHLHMDNELDNQSFVVKKCNQYMCISTESFKFIDISNFLAAGSSYDQFIKAYHPGAVRKGYFCYDFFDNPDKLELPHLPAYDAFYSELKQCNVLEAERIAYENFMKDGIPEREALQKLGLKTPPKNGRDKYSELEKLWVDENMSTFKDYLIYYNNLDVQPFRDAVQKLLEYYHQQNVDVFKTCISVPGVARTLLFRSIQGKAHFSLFDRRDESIHRMFQRNIVGGPAIVFRRFHEKDVTRIRDGAKPCKSILGLDANALYLHSLSEAMPTGPYSVRREETGFQLEKRDKYLKAFKWLDWVSENTGCEIQHRMNSGREIRIGPYRVDGFDSRTQTVYEFDGCYFHGHDCLKNVDPAKQRRLRERTISRRTYIRSRGYRVCHIWECEFDCMLRENDEMREYCNRSTRDKHDCRTPESILHAIMTDKIFGAVEVDISVPDHLRDKFGEMSPIFGNTSVPYEAIGRYTQELGRKIGTSTKPRRLLIGGMRARQILLATPLIKWYVSHGLEVTRVYKLVEYDPKYCFKRFTQDISDARRAGDADPRLSIIAETNKLIGNSSYGSMLMRKDRHSNVNYYASDDEAYCRVNSKNFQTLTELGDNYYEIESSKSRIQLDIPIQIGFFILQYAKLRMLSFYYDCLDKYVDRRDFELMAMDTDSYYMALSGECLEDLIRPELKDEFVREKNHWFPRTDTPEARAYTKRTPGLFKVEMTGQSMVCLCAKTYAVQKSAGDTVESKFSCKGINKSQLRHPINMYKDVLFKEETRSGINRGFRVVNNTVFTYEQNRCGFTGYYVKRRVLDDGIRTEPLDITIDPNSD